MRHMDTGGSFPGPVFQMTPLLIHLQSTTSVTTYASLSPQNPRGRTSPMLLCYRSEDRERAEGSICALTLRECVSSRPHKEAQVDAEYQF